MSFLGAVFVAGAALFFGQVGGLATTSRGVQSIEISGVILAAMADAAAPMLLKDLAGAIQFPPGQIHPYLVSLRKLGLVEQSLSSGHYQLGPAALRLALAHVQSRQSVGGLWEALPDLTTEMGAGMTMSVCCRFGPIILRTAEVPDQPFTNLRAGSLYSVTATATGRLFAAFKDEADVAAIYERQRPGRESKQAASVLETPTYKAMIETIRREGVSWTTGHPAPGISALSAPIFDGTEIVAAITAIAPSEKLDVSKDSEQWRRLREIASRYSAGTAAEQGDRTPQ